MFGQSASSLQPVVWPDPNARENPQNAATTLVYPTGGGFAGVARFVNVIPPAPPIPATAVNAEAQAFYRMMGRRPENDRPRYFRAWISSGIASLGNMMTSSTDEPRVGNLAAQAKVLHGTGIAEQLRSSYRPFYPSEALPFFVVLDESCERGGDWKGREARLHLRKTPKSSPEVPQIESTPGVRAFAEQLKLSKDLFTIGELCLRLVPAAQHVLISVVEDPEEGTAGIHFRVRTSSAVNAVVAAEDQLHDALFEHIRAENRSLFSIGYDFVR